MKLLSLVLVMLLVGCNSITAPNTVEVKVPVPVPCDVPVVQKPVFPFTDTASTKDNVKEKVLKALSELQVRNGYELDLSTALDTCRKAEAKVGK